MKISEFIDTLQDIEEKFPNAEVKCQDPYKMSMSDPDDVIKIKGDDGKIVIFYGNPHDFE